MSSKIIYTSEKVLPYVYMGKHKITGKIYIGVRYASIKARRNLPSHLDLFNYRTSSTVVEPIFDEFDWHIVAEFFSEEDACNFEIDLINEYWETGLLFNKSRRKSGQMIFRTDYENRSRDKELLHKENLSISHLKFWSQAPDDFRKQHQKSTSKSQKQMWANWSEEERQSHIEKCLSWTKDEEKIKFLSENARRKSSIECEIDGVRYESIKVASSVLDTKVKVISARLKQEDWPSYKLISNKIKPNRTRVSVNGVIYDSLREAERQTGIKRHLIKIMMLENNPEHQIQMVQ